MPGPSNSEPTVPASRDPGSGAERQDTLLLSEVPDAADLLKEPAPSAPASAQPSSASLAALAQRYDILAEAGTGSMGNVYKCRDRETGETVAIKLLKPEIASDQAMMERFKNELLFARKITHKNVCRVYEFNRLGGIAYTTMEFVEGESLRSVLNRFGGLPVRKGLELVLQICSGLKEAHAQGIVHRDLKPENIMIDTQGNVKIMDFGIARSMEALTRLTGSMVGTPAYMAPEQVGGKAVDYRTDVYALGLILYEILTGKQAFHADNAVAVALKQMRESPTPPHELEPSIPVSTERTILRCLEKEPSKRFQTIAQLEEALQPSPTALVAGTAAATPPLRVSDISLRPSVHRQQVAPEPKSKAVWVLIWILVGGGLAFGALEGRPWIRAAKMAAAIPPPAPLPAPKPPDFALEVSTEQPAPPEASDATAPPPAKTGADTEATQPTANAQASASTPPVAAPPKKQPRPAAVAAANQNAPSRPARASDDNGSTAPLMQSDGGPKYLRVGYFANEETAQGAARKIRGLGLPVVVVPRRNQRGERFFVILTGPFDANRVDSVVEWLQTQGFSDVQELRLPTGNRRRFPADNP